MAHDNYNMDEQLRKLDNQSLPDLSAIDEHWMQMKKNLQQGGMGKKEYRRAWRIPAAAGIIGLLCFAIFQWTSRPNHKKTATPGVSIPSSAPSAPGDPVAPLEGFGKNDTAGHGTEKSSAVKRSFPATNIVIRSHPIVSPVIPPANDTLSSAADAGMTLEGFFSQLEKPAQEFVIDSRRDTVLTGTDGTALLIRAHTFSSQRPVTLILKEYYSYEDIVTNRLTTVSNDKQLVSGGMIQLIALADGKEVNIQPGRSIRWFVPDTTAGMSQMQLFTREEIDINENIAVDSTASYSSINWVPQTRSFSRGFLMTTVKVLDLRDYPFEVTYGRRVKAKFYMNNASELNKEELRQLLIKKYPKYDKIVIRKAGKRDAKEGYFKQYNLFGLSRSGNYTVSVGDSTRLDPREAAAYKLPATDTLTYWSGARFVENDFFRSAALREIAGRYSVDISSLGWINCDRFYNDNRPMINYVVNLPDTASLFSTLLVFDKIKSVMPGKLSGKRIIFSGVPEGESAKLISVGVRNSRTISALQNVVLSRQPLKSLQFEETDPSGFKKEVARMDQPSGNSL